MAGYISLTFAGITVNYSQIQTGPVPRMYMEMVENARSALGYIINKGHLYEDQHSWEFTAFFNPITLDELHKTNRIYRAWHAARRNRQDTKILLIDTTHRFDETPPRTRAVAPSPDNTVITYSDNGDISYYAQFWVAFGKKPVYSMNDKSITLFLEETEIKTTP